MKNKLCFCGVFSLFLLPASFEVTAQQTAKVAPQPAWRARTELPKVLRYPAANRFTLHSNKLPVMGINPTVVTPDTGYIPFITYKLDLMQGVGPVSANINRTPDLPLPSAPQVAFTDQFEVKGRWINSYHDANDAWVTSLGVLVTNADNRFAVLGLLADADDWELSDGRTLGGSEGERNAYTISYGHNFGQHTLDYAYMVNEGDDIGAPVHSMDVKDFEAKGHIVAYRFADDSLEVSARLRSFSIDQLRDNWRRRAWFQTEGVTGETGNFRFFDGAGSGIYPNPHCSPSAPASSPYGNCSYRNSVGYLPNVGPTSIIPGSQLFDGSRDTQLYLGTLNSKVNVEQNTDVLDYRFDLATEFAGVRWLVGIDGYRREIDVYPRKPWNSEAFSYDNIGLANPILPQPDSGINPADPFDPATFDPTQYGLISAVDWLYFQPENSTSEDMDSFFVDAFLPLSSKTELYLGARYKYWSQKSALFLDERGLNGRFLYEVLGLRHVVENINEVTYTGGTLPEGEQTVGNSGVDMDQSDWDLDLVASLSHKLDDRYTISVSAASYYETAGAYERFFPAPFDPASSSSDGKIYFGNNGIKSEHHKRVEFGLKYLDENLLATARVYYDRIEDYIQGVQVIETTRNRNDLRSLYQLACGTSQYMPFQWAPLLPPGTELDPLAPLVDPFTGEAIEFEGDCLSGQALRYANVDAEMYGFDAGFSYWFSPNWQLTGLISYQRGKRRDDAVVDLGVMDPAGNGVAGNGRIGYIEDDNLFQVLPGHIDLGLTYHARPFTVDVTANLYQSQDDVSEGNLEQTTAGYGIINAVVSYKPHPAIALEVGVNNLFDKQYTDHLTGVNRAFNPGGDPDLYSPGERLAGIGRNGFIRLTLGIKYPMK